MSGALEQITQAEAYKDEGNRHYREGNYKRALGAYHKVFCYVNGLQAPADCPADAAGAGFAGIPGIPSGFAPASQIPRESLPAVKMLKQSTRLNMAACYLKLGEHQKCVDACTTALELGSNSKAHFRRGQAYAELRNLTAARNDLEKAHKLAPDDKTVSAELKKLRAGFAKGDENERKQFAKMFAKASAADEGSTEAAARAPEAAATSGAAANAVQASASGAAPVVAAHALSGTSAEGGPTTDAAAAPAASAASAAVVGATPPAPATVVLPANSEVRDEARKLDVAVRELTYAWQQSEEDVKIYIPFDQSDELKDGVEESRIQVEYAEWSILLVIQSTVEGRTPLGLRLGDFHRRIAPEKCRCTVRDSRITIKLVKQAKEHWWNLLQDLPLHAA